MAHRPRGKAPATLLHRSVRLVARRIGGDGGMTIIEICVASMVLSVMLIGVVGSMGAGLSLVGQGRQRSSGTEVAQQAMEAVHQIPYAQVAVNATPAHSADASDPDFYVNGSTYDPDGSGPQLPEQLVVDTGAGLVTPSDTVTVGQTRFTVYRFVTWVDDPSIPATACPSGGATTCDYKRVVVVAAWTDPVHHGSSNSVTQSTFVTDGLVNVAATTVQAVPPGTLLDHLAVSGGSTALAGLTFNLSVSAQDASNIVVPTYTDKVHFASSDPTAILPADYTFGSADKGTHSFSVTFRTLGAQTLTVSDTMNASLAPQTSPAIAVSTPPCPGDAVAPTGTSVSFGALQYTSTASINVTIGASDGCSPISADLSNDQKNWVTASSALASGKAAIVPWTLSSGDAAKTVYARFRDGNGNQSTAVVTPTTIILDTTAPTAPGQPFVSACTVTGTSKAISLGWTPSTDPTNVVIARYLVKRSDLATPFTALTAAYVDTQVTKDATYTYTVTAVDNAGNASAASPARVVVFTRNVGSC